MSLLKSTSSINNVFLSFSSSGASVVAIDNKIEQAMVSNYYYQGSGCIPRSVCYIKKKGPSKALHVCDASSVMQRKHR